MSDVEEMKELLLNLESESAARVAEEYIKFLYFDALMNGIVVVLTLLFILSVVNLLKKEICS